MHPVGFVNISRLGPLPRIRPTFLLLLPPAPVIPPCGDAFSKICKDFRSMRGKSFRGTEMFIEARNWLKEVEDPFGIFDLDDCKKVQWAAWLMKDEASFWWEVTNGEHVVET